IAANKNLANNNNEKANLLFLAADTLNLLNDACFLYNNVNKGINNGLNTTGTKKDTFIHAFFTLRDITKIYQHFKDLVTSVRAQPEQVDELDELAKPTPEEEKTISHITKTCQLYLLPGLKALATAALAYKQEFGSSYEEECQRHMATTAYALVRFIDEYNQIKDATSYTKKAAALALLATIACLVYELKQYIIPTRGECSVCYANGDEGPLVRLACGHADLCPSCAARHIDTPYFNAKRTFNQIKCPHVNNIGKGTSDNCQYTLSRSEVTHIANDPAFAQHQNTKAKEAKDTIKQGIKLDGRIDTAKITTQDIIAAFDEAAAFKKNTDSFDVDGVNLFVEETTRCPKCHLVFEIREGCNHATCNCKYEFCMVCGVHFEHGDNDWQHFRNCQHATSRGGRYGNNGNFQLGRYRQLPLTEGHFVNDYPENNNESSTASVQAPDFFSKISQWAKNYASFFGFKP
ncbi:MAG: hypothetical protein WCT20_05475, partial [Candidatus Babeliales bacterium]